MLRALLIRTSSGSIARHKTLRTCSPETGKKGTKVPHALSYRNLDRISTAIRRSQRSQLDFVPPDAENRLRDSMLLQLCIPLADGVDQLHVVRRQLLQVPVRLTILALRGRVALDDEPVRPRTYEPQAA